MSIDANESLSVLGQVTTSLTDANVSYMLTGSFASSIHGVFRATADIDIDIVAALTHESIAKFVQPLLPHFVIDEVSLEQAVCDQRSFHIIHRTSAVKVDIFVRRDDPISVVQLQRAVSVAVPGLTELVRTASAEDIILSKLQWYQLGNDVSERQWNDIQGVIAVHRMDLATDYLEQMAQKMGVLDLLSRAYETFDAQRQPSVPPFALPPVVEQ